VSGKMGKGLKLKMGFWGIKFNQKKLAFFDFDLGFCCFHLELKASFSGHIKG
jgi:hypothetical protein